MTVNSSKHRAEMAYAIGMAKTGGKGGLEIVGKDEFTRIAESTPDRSEDVAWDRTAWREAATKAYNDLKYKNVPDPHLTTLDEVSAELIDSPQLKT
jgi:hypothetical protein